MNTKKEKGFTLIEIIVVVTILLVLTAVAIPNYLSIKKQTDVDNGAQELVGILTLARSKTMASEVDKKYGVYLNSSVSPNKYTLFQGASYASREPSADQNYFLTQDAEFYGINITKVIDGTAAQEIVFAKLTGASEEQGSFSIRSKTDISQSKTVYIYASGTAGLNPLQEPDDASRVKDTRHVKFDYSRMINTSTESITLDFNNGVKIYTFLISENLVSGELDWQGVTSVAGADQIIRIHTKEIGTNTQFSIHRDRRYNNASLKITISGDAGSLIEYSADGSEISHTSIYVSNVEQL